ncbi:uncharacterized protein LOC130404219 [Gadus chalcogrammus]|uniref:uncharacterized protein LOC130404219 n=1 Tax=Gadus chalcogrammus TaxID=1042646 RepID=UPI0024C49B5E|nr:uncharacterized protein LOC130404219 [Gadus chalcogrammus]
MQMKILHRADFHYQPDRRYKPDQHYQTDTLLSRDCSIVERSQFFKRRRALKLRSASQEETGTTSNSLTRASTWVLLQRGQTVKALLVEPLIQLHACCIDGREKLHPEKVLCRRRGVAFCRPTISVSWFPYLWKIYWLKIKRCAFIETFKLQENILPKDKAKYRVAFLEMVKKATCSRSCDPIRGSQLLQCSQDHLVLGLATKTREWKIETEQHIGGNSPEMLASCGRGLVQPYKLLPWFQILVHIAEADGDLLCSTDVLCSVHYEGILQHRDGLSSASLQGWGHPPPYLEDNFGSFHPNWHGP